MKASVTVFRSAYAYFLSDFSFHSGVASEKSRIPIVSGIFSITELKGSKPPSFQEVHFLKLFAPLGVPIPLNNGVPIVYIATQILMRSVNKNGFQEHKHCDKPRARPDRRGSAQIHGNKKPKQ